MKSYSASSQYCVVSQSFMQSAPSLFKLIVSNRKLVQEVVDKIGQHMHFNTYRKEELYQNLLLRSLKTAFVYNQERAGSPAPILFTITNNLAIDMIRSIQREKTVTFDTDAGLTGICDNARVFIDKELYIKELRLLLKEGIQELRDHSRSQTQIDAFVMVMFDELPENEVARRLHIAESTVANSKRRCLRRLRPIMQRLLKK